MVPRLVAILAVAFIAYGYKDLLNTGWPSLGDALPYLAVIPLFFVVGVSMFRAR